MVREFWEARLLAWKLGSYPNCAMARRTFSFVSSLIEGLFLQVLDTVEEDTVVSLAFDKERLYKNMVAAKADWLYELPQWDEIFTPEKRKELYLEQKKSGTVVKAKKIGRNDPCPCGSGKKYKYCCGKNA